MRILIVDAQPLYREALGLHIKAIYPEATIFEASNVVEAQGMLKIYAEFALIVLDVSVLGLKRFEWLSALHKASSESKFIVISSLDDPKIARELLQQGADGYITKMAGARDMRNGIQLVMAGEIYISPSLLFESSGDTFYEGNLAPAEIAANLLTPRQQEVLCLMGKGLPNKTIAEHLQCSDGTIRLHVSAIFRVLGVKNRTSAVQKATSLGII